MTYASSFFTDAGRSLTVAGITARECARESSTVAFTLLASLLLLVTPLFDINLFGSDNRLVQEIVPGTIAIFGLAITAALAHATFARERKTGGATLIMSSPLGRDAYVAGKLLGLEIVLFSCALCMGLAGIISVVLWGLKIDLLLVAGIILAVGQVIILGAASIFFASVGTLPFIAAGLAVLYVVGNLSAFMQEAPGSIIGALFLFLPRFDLFTVSGAEIAGNSAGAILVMALLSVVVGTVFFYAASSLVYRFREFS